MECRKFSASRIRLMRTIFTWGIRDYQIPSVPTNFMCSKVVTSRLIMVFLLHGKLLAYATDGHAKAFIIYFHFVNYSK